MHLIRKDRGKKLRESDSPWLSDQTLIFRAAPAMVLESMLTKYGELLPLECEEAELVAFNVTCVVDALDEQGSELTRFGDGRIMMIDRHAFRPSPIASVDAFKIPNLRFSPTYVSDRFVDLWKKSGLRGLSFTEIWSG